MLLAKKSSWAVPGRFRVSGKRCNSEAWNKHAFHLLSNRQLNMVGYLLIWMMYASVTNDVFNQCLAYFQRLGLGAVMVFPGNQSFTLFREYAVPPGQTCMYTPRPASQKKESQIMPVLIAFGLPSQGYSPRRLIRLCP